MSKHNLNKKQMKKIISTLMVSFIVTCQLQAQIEVGSNNHVGIGITGTVDSKLSVNTSGNANYIAAITNLNTATGQGVLLLTKAQPSNNTYYAYGLASTIAGGLGYTLGISTSSYSSTASNYGRSYGIYAQAGNSTSGYNYGVYGRLLGSNNGAGVFGTISGDIATGGKYAGYFYGTTKVNGDFWVGSVQVTSDMNAKKEIKQLDKNNVSKIKQMKAVSYKYKDPIEMGQYGTEITDTLTDTSRLFDKAEYEQIHIGLLAQELQAVYPELVKTDPSGMLGIDYIGLIPVLLEAIKEQQAAIETLTDEVEKLKAK